jgi:ribonucleotide reductase beta subunit family protein with ferritin-like domain
VSSAVKIEMKFIVDALPVELIWMNLAITMMCNYIRFCTDQLLLSLGCGRHYKIGNLSSGWRRSVYRALI